MKTIIGAFCLVTILYPSLGNQNNPQPKEVLSSFCQFALSERLMQDNISFTEGYTFKLDDDGRSYDIRRFRGGYVNEELVRACLGKWKFSGFTKDTRFMVDFYWKHGEGWREMRIHSKDFSQITILNDERCPESNQKRR